MRRILWHMAVKFVKEDEASNACYHGSVFISIYQVDKERKCGK